MFASSKNKTRAIKHIGYVRKMHLLADIQWVINTFIIREFLRQYGQLATGKLLKRALLVPLKIPTSEFTITVATILATFATERSIIINSIEPIFETYLEHRLCNAPYEYIISPHKVYYGDTHYATQFYPTINGLNVIVCKSIETIISTILNLRILRVMHTHRGMIIYT